MFFAHSTQKGDRADWQPLAEHLLNVGRMAGRSAAVFGAGRMAEAAGILHDIGKYTEDFQRRISGEAVRVDHATRGAMLALEWYGPVGYLLAYGIAGHHAGLANGYDGGERTALRDRLAASAFPRSSRSGNTRSNCPVRSEICRFSLPGQSSVASRPHFSCGCCSRAWSMRIIWTPKPSTTGWRIARRRARLRSPRSTSCATDSIPI
ncbi:MAG: CRISPR-associated endonuclease Cas3'' [Aromatoleum sp.]|uniref:CRISPR-associated endonuclease Cas3'' n=1 Tax=Aromatoleum sp. TaxID=2307007 RepID=UPI0028941409|nr:CRISPR-associated endonuclease Cas3'' [Aromatoleum sp.]MDT3672037.1 CRISPR-associated endonuclease Cas3'' [Aromatoleum sp.]